MKEIHLHDAEAGLLGSESDADESDVHWLNKSASLKRPADIGEYILRIVIGLGAVLVTAVFIITRTSHDSSAYSEPPHHEYRDSVIMISIDGFRHDYLDIHEAPTMKDIALSGTRVARLKPIFVSKTFPNHYTLVTGLHAESHGIVSNTMYDPNLGYFSIRDPNATQNSAWWDAAEPLWVTAEKKGIVSACFFWPGSETLIHGYRPTYYKKYNTSIPYASRIQQVLDWIDMPLEKRPKLILTYFENVDRMGHAYGPRSHQVREALYAVDEAIKQLMDGLKSRKILNDINLIILADHGMTEMDPKDKVIALNKYIDLTRIQFIDVSVVSSICPKYLSDTIELYNNLTNAHPNLTCWLKDEISVHFHYRNNVRIQPIICQADLGFSIIRGDGDAAKEAGSHGYDNDFGDMHGSLLLHGPRFTKRAELDETIENVHVYPLLSNVLGIEPRTNNGSLQRVAHLLAP